MVFWKPIFCWMVSTVENDFKSGMCMDKRYIHIIFSFQMHNLPRPFKTACEDKHLAGFKKYTKSACLLKCRADYIIGMCKCRSYDLEGKVTFILVFHALGRNPSYFLASVTKYYTLQGRHEFESVRGLKFVQASFLQLLIFQLTCENYYFTPFSSAGRMKYI